jgi:hypothetical protein
MTPADVLCGQVLLAACEGLFLAGAVWVWRALLKMDVNGPCQLGIGLLVLLRLRTMIAAVGGPGSMALDWAWLTEALFSFVFLYTLYHMGVLISTCRR